MRFRPGLTGLGALLALGSCGKEGVGIADVLLVSTVEVTPPSGELMLGESTQLSATPRTTSGRAIPGRSIVWSSSLEAVVSVSATGVITALAVGGPVRVTASVDGITGEALITVRPLPVARVIIAPSQAGLVVGGSRELTATAYDANGAPLGDRLIIWQSSAPTIVAVTSTGIVLGMTEGGPVTITATSEGKSGTAFVSVVPRPATRLQFVQQPGSVTAGQPMAPAVRVAIQNDQGGLVPAATNPVSIALGSNLPGATLSGTTTVAAVNGIATFSNLSVDRAGAGYTLTVASPGLAPATSSSFSNAAGPANRLTIATAPPVAASSGIPLTPQPSLQLQDAFGNPAGQAGVVVTASVTSGTATLGGGMTATTNAAGTATFSTLSLSGPGGSVTLSFSAPGLAPVAAAPLTLSAATAAVLALVTQPSAAAQSGVPLAVQPTVQLRDATGNDVNSAGVAITAAIASGPAGAVLGGGKTVSTGASGTAVFANLAITGPPGSYMLQFNSSGISPVTSSTITIAVGSPSQLTITTQPSSSATNGMPFSRQPVLQLSDVSGNAVSQSGVPVTAAIASGPAGAVLGGGKTVSTGASGAAPFTNLAITGPPGSYTLQFSSSGISSVTSSMITIAVGSASQLTITTQPSGSATNGTAFSQQPVLQLRDASGNAVSQSGIAVTAAIASGGGTLGGTVTVSTDGAGVARFTSLSISGIVGNRTLGFSASGLTGATSGTINLVAGPASQLAITTQPSGSATNGTAFSQQPVLQLRDASGNAVSQSGIAVTAAIASGGGTLGGTSTVSTDGAGKAKFTDLSISGTVGNRTLGFSAPGLSGATSSTINITVGPASQLSITLQPSATATSGVPFSQQPVIQLRDASSNLVSAAGFAVSAAIFSGPGALSGTLTVTTNASGVASFTNLALTGSGTYLLVFTCVSLADAISIGITVP